MNRKIFVLFVLISLVNVISLKAEKTSMQNSEYHLISKIFENHRYCVAAFEENKIFIRPENIISTNQGLFINLNGAEYYQLPLLQFNKNGHFIEGKIIQTASKKKEKTKGFCPNCDENTDKNGYCRNPRCFFYGFKVM